MNIKKIEEIQYYQELDDFDGIINEATTQQITDKAFYTTTLGWDEQIWDLSNVSNDFTPKLQGLDPNATKAVGVHKAEIYSVDEFISELSAHPEMENSQLWMTLTL